jgi:hypothetical protein
MTTEELFGELRRLSRADKLRAMQVLVMELASEEDALIVSGASYEVWSPYDATEAAQTLLDMLEADKHAG